MFSLLAATTRYWSVGAFVSLLWLTTAVKLEMPLPTALMLTLVVYLLVTWMMHILAAFWQRGKGQTQRLTAFRPSRVEWFGIGLGMVAGLVLGAVIFAGMRLELRAAAALLLPLSGGWLGVLLVRWLGRLSWIRPLLTIPLAGSWFVTFITALGAGLGFALPLLNSPQTPLTMPVITGLLGQITLWLVSGGSLGYVLGLFLRRIVRLPQGLWQWLMFWFMAGVTVTVSLFLLNPPTGASLQQLLLTATGTGALISLLFIRPSLTILLRSSIIGAAGILLVGSNFEVTIARASALIGIFVGIVASLIVLNWMQSQQTS